MEHVGLKEDMKRSTYFSEKIIHISRKPKRFRIVLCVTIGMMIINVVQDLASYSTLAMDYDTFSLTELRNTSHIKATFTSVEMRRLLIIMAYYVPYALVHAYTVIFWKVKKIRIVFMVTVWSTVLLTMSVPLGVKYFGWIYYMVIRFLIGLISGQIFSPTSQYINNWTPIIERDVVVMKMKTYIEVARAVTAIYCGIIGQFLAWEWLYYLIVIPTIIWYIAFFYIAYESPKHVTSMSAEEYKIFFQKDQVQLRSKMRLSHVIKQSLKESSLNAILIANISHVWTRFFFYALLPSFLYIELRYYFIESCTYTGLAFLVYMLSIKFFNIAFEVYRYEQNVKVLDIRRYATIACTILLSGTFIGLAFFAANRFCTIIFITLMSIFCSAHIVGVRKNVEDINPLQAREIFMMINLVGGIIGVIMVLVIYPFARDLYMFVIPSNKYLTDTPGITWKAYYILTYAIHILVGNIHIIYLSDQRPDWTYQEVY